MRITLTIASLVAISLSACAHHPADCALGIPHADCLEGTAGYNRGGGQETRLEHQRAAEEALRQRIADIEAEFNSQLTAPSYDQIRSKVELNLKTNSAPPLSIATNDDYATAEERAAISDWSDLRDKRAQQRFAAYDQIYVPASANQLMLRQQLISVQHDANNKVSELIALLYKDKLTYGEFSQQRHAIAIAAENTELSYKSAALVADQQQQVQAQALAAQEFQNRLLTVSAFIQNANTRSPQTVQLKANCQTSNIGQQSITTCR